MGVESITSAPPIAPRTASAAPASQKAVPQAPVKASGDSLALQSKGAFDLPGLASGQTLKVDGKYKSHGFGGKSDVTTFDGKTLDLMVNASAMMGLVKVKVHLRFDSNPDGAVNFLAERVGKESADKVDPNTPSKVGTKLKIVSQKPGQTLLQAPDGKQVSVSSGKGGGLSIAYDQYQITLKS